MTCYEMGRDAVGEEVHHKDSAGDKQNSALGVNIVTLGAVHVARDRPGQVGHTLYLQLLCEVFLSKTGRRRRGQSN